MKKQILALTILASATLSAQLYSPNGAPITSNPLTENVGIGVPSPNSKLHVNGDINSTGWNLPQNSILNIGFNTTDKTNGISNYGLSLLGIYPTGIQNDQGPGTNLSGYFGVSLSTGTQERIRIDRLGNVGINTLNPTRRLTVNGDIYAIGGSAISLQDDTRFNVTASDVPVLINTVSMPHYGILSPSVSGGAELWMAAFKGIRMFTGGESNPKFFINTNGNAYLQGKFEAKEIKVTLTPTADFVFEEDYNLPKLEDVEKHIKEKKHLPEIASAKEMEKEGVNVGEFQIKLLQKIEELTLYTIEQDKRIKELESKINKN